MANILNIVVTDEALNSKLELKPLKVDVSTP